MMSVVACSANSAMISVTAIKARVVSMLSGACPVLLAMTMAFVAS
jgi:hypothetical protein